MWSCRVVMLWPITDHMYPWVHIHYNGVEELMWNDVIYTNVGTHLVIFVRAMM